MNLTELKQGQDSEIARLHTRSILRLYAPLTVEEAAMVPNHGLSSLPHHQGEPGVIKREGGLPVTHELRIAAQYGDVVVQFTDTASHLSVPEAYNTSGVHSMAETKYPESQMPVVSWLLLESKEPSVYYRGILPSRSIKAYHLVGYGEDGSPARGFNIKSSLSHNQFGTWLINKYQKTKKLAQWGGS